MTEKITVSIPKIEDVKEFVDIMCKYPFTATVYSGKFVIDAKSIMGLFSLDLSKPIELSLDGDDEETNECILDSLKPYIIEEL